MYDFAANFQERFAVNTFVILFSSIMQIWWRHTANEKPLKLTE